MNWTYAITTGLAIGTAGGWLAERLPVAGAAQSSIAVLATSVLTTGLLAWRWAQKNRGRGYVGIGLDNLAWLVGAVVIGAAIHVAVDAIDPAWSLLIDHRPMILGAASGVWIGWSEARAAAILDRLPAMEDF